MTMHRRGFLTTLAAASARAQSRIAPLFDSANGTAILVDIATRRPLAMHDANAAARLLAPPGSTMKPLAIASLLELGKLRPNDTFHCPGTLVIGDRNLTCSHPLDLGPIHARTAIAYSCNCFVAHYAERFARAELPGALARYGLASRTGWAEDETAGELGRGDPRLQALGEEGVLVTPAALAASYCRLAVTCGRASLAAVLGGLEDAVEFGTAQRARVAGLRVAGKTGSVRAADGAHLAWFAGFAPAVPPRFAVVVMLQGKSGGGDAAPVAARILEAAWRGRL